MSYINCWYPGNPGCTGSCIEVYKDKVVVNDNCEIPCGLVVWAAGLAPRYVGLLFMMSLQSDVFEVPQSLCSVS